MAGSYGGATNASITVELKGSGQQGRKMPRAMECLQNHDDDPFNMGMRSLAQEGRQPRMASRPRSSRGSLSPSPTGLGHWHQPQESTGWLGGGITRAHRQSQLVIGHLQELCTHIPDTLALRTEEELVVAAICTDSWERRPD